MRDRVFPSAVDGTTGHGLRRYLDGEAKATRKTIRKAAKRKPFPFHPAERSGSVYGTFARMDSAPKRK